MELINFKGKTYPKFQSEGHASQFARPYAQRVCKGKGVDVGCNRNEWMLYPVADEWFDTEGTYDGLGETNMRWDISYPIDPEINNYDATHFPDTFYNLDFIFSSHCLEHILDWVPVMDYWYSRLRVGGVLFLYLPDYSQEYWKPWNNRKHVNVFTQEMLYDYMEDKGYKNIFYSGTDLNNSFMIFGEKFGGDD